MLLASSSTKSLSWLLCYTGSSISKDFLRAFKCFLCRYLRHRCMMTMTATNNPKPPNIYFVFVLFPFIVLFLVTTGESAGIILSINMATIWSHIWNLLFSLTIHWQFIFNSLILFYRLIILTPPTFFLWNEKIDSSFVIHGFLNILQVQESICYTFSSNIMT